MKIEILNIANRGPCLVISDFTSKDIGRIMDDNQVSIAGTSFTQAKVYEIADCIRNGKKIQAIKIVRSETGMGLKEAKEYMDTWYPTNHNFNALNRNDDIKNISLSKKFILAHLPNDFINSNEMEI